MNIKIIIIKIKIFWLKLIGKINTEKTNILLKNNGHNSKNIIVIFPMDDSLFRVALYIFRDIDDIIQSYNNELNIYYFVKDSFSKKFSIKTGIFKELIINKKGRIINYSELFNFVKSREFDLVIDLARGDNLDCIKLISFISSKLKVGFKNGISDSFYNIQFSMGASGILENGMRKMKEMIIT